MEGAGEGMVAIVQALQDAGLTVTLTNAANERCEHARRSHAYNGMGKALRWNGQVSRATNSQTDAFNKYHAGGHNGIMDSYQTAHCSKSTASPLSRNMEASPHTFKHHYNENAFYSGGPRHMVTQTPVRDAASCRSSAYWYQRAIPSTSRSSRGTDAFAESLRKYPAISISPERSPSADIIQRLLNYNQSKNLTRSSYHSKSLRSLRHTEPCKETNICTKKSAKNIQTYTRTAPTRETSPYYNDLRFRERKRSLHSPKSDNIKCKDNPQCCTYDYLKGTSPNFSPPRGTEVRYLEDVTKYVRDTLKQICDEKPMTCPKIASRYSQHKRQCPRKTMLQSSSESVHREVQTSPPVSRDVATSLPVDNDKTLLPPKICDTCLRPLPCLCRKSSSIRKIRFSTVEPCPGFVVQEVNPKLECPENDPCPCPESNSDELRQKLEEQIQAWLKEIPVSATFSLADKNKRKEVIKDLVDKLMKLKDIDDYEDRMRKEVLECLENLPMWLPSGKRDNDVFKNELADNLIINRLRKLFQKRDKFDETIAKWVDQLNFDSDAEPVNKGKITQDLINRLNTLNRYRTDDNDLYEEDLKNNIFELLEKLPINVKGSKTKYNNDKADKLAKALAALQKFDVEENDLMKKLILDWLQEIPEAKGLKPSAIKNLVEQLSGNVRDLFQNDMNDIELQDIIKIIIDDWLKSTLTARPHDDLMSNLIKNIREFLENTPELCGNTHSAKKDNANISKRLAKKTKDLLPELLENNDIKDTLWEEINSTLRDMFEKRGKSNNPKTTKRLAKDLLNKLLDAVKIGYEKLENDLRMIILNWLGDKPELAGNSPSFKNDNAKISNELAKKVTDLLPDLLEDEDVKDKLLEDVIDQLNEILEKKGEYKDPKTAKRLAKDLLNKLVDAVKTQKTGTDQLENDLRKIVLTQLENTPQLTGDTSSNKRDNDQLSEYFVKKILKVPPEYLENEAVKENLLEDVNDQLKNALKKRGHRKDTKSLEKLAENIMNNLSNAVKKAKDSKDSTTNPLKNTLQNTIIESLNDIPELADDSPTTKRDNDKLSIALAEKMLEVPPEYLDTDDNRDNLTEDINDQLKDALTKRGHRKDPKSMDKLAENLFDKLKNIIKKANGLEDSSTGPLENVLRKKIIESLDDVPELAGGSPQTKRDNDKLSTALAKKMLEVPPEYLNTGDIRDNLIEDINYQLKDALIKRGHRKDPRSMDKLAENLFDKLQNTIKKAKGMEDSSTDPLENILKKKIIESLDDVPELAGDSPTNKRDNDEISTDLAKKILEVPPEYLDTDNICNNLVENINDQLKDALKKRGHRKDPKFVEKLAEHLFDSLKNVIVKSKGIKDSNTDPLENTLRKKIIECLENLPELASDSSTTKRDNDKISTALAKKMLEVPPEYLDNDYIRDSLIENINDQLNDTLQKRGHRKDPKSVKKIGAKLFENLKNEIIKAKGIKDSSTDLLKNTLRKEIIESLEGVPELASDSPTTTRDNNKISTDLAKKFLEVSPEDLDCEDVKDNLVQDINNQLNDALTKRGQRLDPKDTQEIAEDMLNKLVNVINKAKTSIKDSTSASSDKLENELRNKVLECIEDVPELSVDTPSNRRENDKISKKIAEKVRDFLPDLLEDENLKEWLLDEINETLKDTLEKRGEYLAPKAITKLAENVLNKLVRAAREDKGKREMPQDSDALKNDLQNIILDWLYEIPELAGNNSPSIRKDNEKFSENLAKKICELPSGILEDKDVQQLLDEIINRLNNVFQKRDLLYEPKVTAKLAEDLVERLMKCVKKANKKKEPKSVNDMLESNLRKKTLDWMELVPELAGDSPSNIKDNENLSKDIAKQIFRLPRKALGDNDVLDNLKKEVKDKLTAALKKRGYYIDLKTTEELAKDLVNTLIKEKPGFSRKDQEKKKLLKNGSSSESVNMASSSAESADLRNPVWNWFKDIPELAVGDIAEDKKAVDKFADQLQRLEDEGGSDKQMQNIVDNWLEKISENKGVKLTNKEKDKLKDKLLDAIGSKPEFTYSYDEPEEIKRKVWNWFNNIPEISAGDSMVNKESIDRLADKLQKIKNVGGDKQKMHDTIDDWLHNTSKKKDVYFSKPEKKILITDLMNSLKSITPKSSFHVESETKRKIWNWFKDIPGLSVDDNAENIKFVDELADKLSKYQESGDKSRKNKQKMMDEIDNWFEDALNKKGVILNQKEKDRLKNKLTEIFKSMPIRKNIDIKPSINNSEEPSGPVWDWFKKIPEISSGDKSENRLKIVELDNILQKLKDQINDVHGKEEIEDAIEDWLEDVTEKKGIKINSTKRRNLRKKLMDTIQPKLTSKQPVIYSDDESGGDSRQIWEWFTDIPEISSGDHAKNLKLVNRLDDKLKKIQGQDLEYEHIKHKMQGAIDNWLQDIAFIKGEKLNTRIKEDLRNKLMRSLNFSEKHKSHGGRQVPTSHVDEDFRQKVPQIWDWFNRIPEISRGNKTANKNQVEGLAKHLQNIEDSGSDEENRKFHLQGTIDSWLRKMCQRKNAKLNIREIESHRDNLMNSLKCKPHTKIIRSASDEDEPKDEQKIWHWFKGIPKLASGSNAENKKLINELVEGLEKVYESSDNSEHIADKIKDEVDNWIKNVSKKKHVRCSLDEIEGLKKILLDSIGSKPKQKAQKNRRILDYDDGSKETRITWDSDGTNSGISVNTDSKSRERDDIDESIRSKNKPKTSATEKLIDKLKAYKSALKGFKDASVNIDNDRQKIARWLQNIPEIKFDDQTESENLVEKFASKLKILKIEGKINSEKDMKEEVKTWLEEIYKKKRRKLDDRTKENLVNELVDSMKMKPSDKRKGNTPSDQSIGGVANKGKLNTTSKSPDKRSQNTYHSYKDLEDSNDLDTNKLKKNFKEMKTSTDDYDNEHEKSSSNNTKDSKRWNKEHETLSNEYSNEYESANRGTGSPSRKYEIDTILSDDGDTASIASHRIPIKSPSSASRRSQSDYKSSPKRPGPEKNLRQEIIGAGFDTAIVPESNNKRKPPTSKERQKSIEFQSKKPSTMRKSGRRKSSGPSLTPSEISIRKNPHFRTRSDTASRKFIEKSLKSKHGKKKPVNDSNRSLPTEIYYVEGSSESNGHQTRRKSVATQQPIKKTNKKSGEGEPQIKISKKINKPTTAKISDLIMKNIDTVISPNYADIEKDIMEILVVDPGLPNNEAEALAKIIIKQARNDHGINDDDDDEDDPEATEFDTDSGDESSDESHRSMNPTRKLVRNILDESSHFNKNTKHQMQVEDALVDLIADQLYQGDIDDATKDAILKLLLNANVPEDVADNICEKITRRARERPMSFSEYPPPPSTRIRLGSALTPTQKLTFLENAQREIGDFYDTLTDPVNSASKQNIIDEAIKDTVAKLADILDDNELTGQQKKDMMRNELIRYLKKIPTQINMTEEELADQLMDRVQNIKFTSSTPEYSQIEAFHPKRDNLDPSLSTIFDENELEANEHLFNKQLIDAIQSWSENIDAIKDKIGFKDTMAKDLANEIIDRQKYLQVNPDAKTSDEEELEHSKYIVFRWLNKMVDSKDLADCVTQIDNLVDVMSTVSVPKMAEPSNMQRSLAAFSRTSQGALNLSNPLEIDIFEWLQYVPPEIHATNDPDLQERQIKQFVRAIEKHKGKPNVEQLVAKEINQWLSTILNPVDQPLLDTAENHLKFILKKNGFVNPIQKKPVEPVTRTPNENPVPSQQPVESPTVPTNTMSPQKPSMQPQPEIQPQQDSVQPQPGMPQQRPGILQKSDIQSQQPDMQPQPSSMSLLSPMSPQDPQYNAGNHQNPQIIPTDSVTSIITTWVNTIPTHANSPEEQQHLDKMQQHFIPQIKLIRQEYPTTSNEYEPKHNEAIKSFLQNIPLEPEKKQDNRYLTEKTNELLKNLGVVPTDTVHDHRGSPRFKKAADVLYEVVEKWCNNLPIYSGSPTEDPEKINALKQNVASKLIYRIGELNLNPEILNDDFLYEDLLLDEVDKLLKDVPKNPELDKYLPALKMELAAKVKNARQKIRDELAGQAYKQQLRETILTSICLPDNLSPDELASFEILKDNLADAFINLHYVPDNDEEARKFKVKIIDEINRFCNEFLRRHPRLPIDRRKLGQDLHVALLEVPLPRNESMMHEVEQARIKDLINDWMKELPLREETLTEQLQRNKMASILAKRLHELEKEKASNPDMENEMFEEISKWLRKQHLRPGQEVYIPEFAERLKNKLKSTEHSRRFDSSARPPFLTESKPGMVCIGRMPPCTLSREDRIHLQKIRERQRNPCSRDVILFPDTDSYSQTRARSPCSRDAMVCPRMNSYSQTEVRPKCTEHSSWCRKEFCPGKTLTPAQMSGSYCSTRRKRDASCMTSTQNPCEISPHVIVKEYYWDTTDSSNQQASFQQTQTPIQQPQVSNASAYQTPQQSYQTPQQSYQTPQRGYQTPRQSFPQSSQNYVPPPQYMTPQASTSKAYRQNSCECHPPPPTNEEIPIIPTPNQSNVRFRRCYRTPDASSGEDYPETSRSFRRVRVTRLGSLDDMSCRNRRPAENNSRTRIRDDESEWSSVRFPEDGEFWDCPRRVHGAPGFVHEREKRQVKVKCKCKERVLTTCRGRNGRSYREFDTRHCGVHCPHPSYMYFRR